MEKIPAASAMGWSIELDKGLRSNKTGKCIEEMLKFESRLEQWSRESKVTVAEFKCFGLIPGEDKLFLNAIILRLADAFRLGDKEIKTCIVKIFVQELKGRRKRRRCSNKDVGGSIFSKNMMVNYLEILRRVKLVFDNGDAEERALALALFGCWADLTKDSADIRYVLLSCLVSNHILEVKASLFAAGCLCELADDFAYILLEVLVNMMQTSSETSKSLEFKLAVGRAFARMSCSFPIANRAYEVGSKLLLDSCEEQFSSVMLISLTKIASKWTLLIPGQIDLLLSFLSDEKSLQIQATTVHCLDFVLATGLSSYPATTIKTRFHNLFDILRHSDISPALLNKTLKVLYKILLYNLPSLSTPEISDIFSVILTCTKEIIQCSVVSKRILAFRSLVDFTGNPLVRAKESTLVPEVISLIMHRISTLIKSKVDAKQIDVEMEQEVTRLLNLVHELAERHSDVGSLLLDKFCIFIVYLRNMFDMKINRNRDNMVDQESSNFGRETITKVVLKFSLTVTKIMMTCIEKLEAVDTVASQALNSLKLLVENVCDSILFESHILRIHVLMLQFDSVYRCMCRVMGQVLDFNKSTNPFSGDLFCDHELISLKSAKKIIEGRDYWSSYKAGKYAACQGSWSTSVFIFEQLMGKVKSDSCSWWLKSLTLLSSCESQIQLYGHVLLKGSSSGEGNTWKINSCSHTESLMPLHKVLHLAKETLGISFAGVPFSFQRWYLALRIKAVEAVLDITRLLVTFSSRQEIRNTKQQQSTCFISSQVSSKEFDDLVYSIQEISFQLKRTAKEFDLLATSDIGIDKESMLIISALALSCSILAFSTTFAMSTESHASAKFGNCGLERSKEQLCLTLIQDLLGRIWHLDSESSQSLLRLLKVYQNSDSCLSLESHSQAADFSCEGRVVAKLCRYAVLGIVGLQSESNGLSTPEGRTQTCHVGLELLLNIISKWMQIPFRCPIHFFQLREYVSLELFLMNEDGGSIDGKSIYSGSQLLLNVCLQSKNSSSYMPVRFLKLYCILSCTMLSSEGKMKDQSSSSINGQIDDQLDLNEKLLRYVRGSTKTAGRNVVNNTVNHWAGDKYICFHPNSMNQGFSTCLLDISAFPVGVYQIKWHSCCLDNEGSYWSLLPQSAGPIFNIQKSSDSC